MSQELTKFDYLGQGVRIFEEDGKALFVAADVARVLGHRDAATMVRALKEKHKGTRQTRTPGGEQELTVITEPGFYRAVLIRETGRMVDQGTKESVDAFQDWVTDEVLPQIRQTGAYSIEPVQQPQRELSRLELIDIARDAEIGRLTAERELEAAKPKTEYFDSYVRPKDKETVKDWANKYGLTEPQAYAKLLEANLVYKKDLGVRWSKSQHKYIQIREYRPRAGRPSFEWFMLMPQHNAPRLNNGRVRQTLYVRNRHMNDLARKLGVSQPAEQTELILIDDYRDKDVS